MSVSLMIQEIRETTGVLRELVQEEGPGITELGRRLAGVDPDVIIESARGTSDHACIYGQYLTESLLGIPVALALGSLYTHYQLPPVMKKGAVIAVSQSGETEDVCSVAEQTVKSGTFTVGLTNARDSRLARIAGANTIYLHAGPEKSVAATKTFTTSLMAFLMLVHATRGDSFDYPSIIELVDGILHREEEIHDQAVRYTYTNDFVVVGTGYSYALALEGALKLKEACYINAQGLSSVDLIHGPLAILNPDMPVVIFAPDDACLDLNLSVLDRIKQTRAHVLVVSDSDRALGYGDLAFRLPKVDPTVYPILDALFVQLFAYYLAMARKLNPDQPRFLHKVSLIENTDQK